MNVKQTLARIAGELSTLDQQIAEVINSVEVIHEAEVVRLVADYERQLARLEASHVETEGAAKACYEAYLDTLKDKAAEALKELEELERATKDAINLQADVEALRKGVLDTSYLDKRRLFETLAESWEDLTARQIGQIENILTGVTA
jgi:archaellum component FlaC